MGTPRTPRQRKFALYNHAWLELVDEDEAEEYQDAVALNNVLQMQASGTRVQ